MVRNGFWTCNPGFEQVDDRCRQIIAPANARINGNAWVCNPSYIRKGDQCQKLRVPANATVRGNSWSCNAGYRSNGKGQCARIAAPLNATVRGARLDLQSRLHVDRRRQVLSVGQLTAVRHAAACVFKASS